jgi:hypothetical protein
MTILRNTAIKVNRINCMFVRFAERYQTIEHIKVKYLFSRGYDGFFLITAK